MRQMANPFEVVIAECDIVTVIHKMTMQDPAADGELTEHWDGSMLPMRRPQQ